jgi:hypothetical protein
MLDLYCRNLKTKVRVTSREKTPFLTRLKEKNALKDFNYLQLSVVEIDGKKPTYPQIMDFFRETVWDLIGKLKDSNSCVLQMHGELLPDGIAKYFQYVCLDTENNRFYFPEAENLSKDEGYIYSWMSFEYNEVSLEKMRLDNRASLMAFIIEKEDTDYFNTFYKQAWSKASVFKELIHRCISFIEFEYDFDFMDILTKLPKDETINRVKNGLRHYDSKHTKNKSGKLG